MKISVTKQFEVQVTSDQLAEFLALADDHQMAAAFDRLAELTERWESPRQMQWEYMAQRLTPRARALLVELGEYAEGA